MTRRPPVVSKKMNPKIIQELVGPMILALVIRQRATRPCRIFRNALSVLRVTVKWEANDANKKTTARSAEAIRAH